MSVPSRQGAPPDSIQASHQANLQARIPIHLPPHLQVTDPAICPGLFRPSVAQDGYLVRIRVPGGQLTAAQCRLLAAVGDAVSYPLGDGSGNLQQNGTGYAAQRSVQAGQVQARSALEVTNRANLQIRGLAGAMPPELLAQLQAVQLAAHPSIDHLRNLMASPTAGIDPGQLLDTRPLVAALNHHLVQQLGWAGLSAKFSIGFDGGERVSIQRQPNDLRFTAVQPDGSGNLALHLHLAGVDPAYGNFLLPPEALELDQHRSREGQAWVAPVIAVVTALVQLYLTAVEPTLKRKPRLKQVLSQLGADLPRQLQAQLDFPLRSALPLAHPEPTQLHLGVQPQRQPQFSYLGLALPLGQLTAQQLRQLADLLETRGLELRLTPWRTVLLSNVPTEQVPEIEAILADLGLNPTNNAIWSRLVACSGSTGCAASATDTQADALALAQVLAAQLAKTHRDPPTIHVTGCAKSCAHHGSSDLTLVGTKTATGATGYQLYAGNGNSSADQPFGRLVTPPDALLPAAELPQTLTRLLDSQGLWTVQSAPATGLRQDSASVSTPSGGE